LQAVFSSGLRGDIMATMRELQAEYELLIRTHRHLLDERSQLHRESTSGAQFVDYSHKIRTYMRALDTYVLALAARRAELEQHKRNARSYSSL
jgi:hypothetical protein